MTFETYASSLETDSMILERMVQLFGAASGRQFSLVFLDSRQRQCPTIVPVDGIPDTPDPADADRFAPVMDWLADGEGGSSVIIVLERPGSRILHDHDRSWIRTLRRCAAIAELPVRAQLLVHDDGVRWLAPDDYL